MFKNALGHCELTDNLMGVRYTKLTDNSCFSGLATALGCLVGDILDNRTAMEIIAYTGRECAKIIKVKGIKPVELFGLCPTMENVSFETKEELDAVITYWSDIYKAFRNQKASMIQDLEKGRKCVCLKMARPTLIVLFSQADPQFRLSKGKALKPEKRWNWR